MPRTFESAECAKARLHPPKFGLTARAMKFAKLYAENPHLGIAACAREAGYSDKSGAASVRGAELLRDPRVLQAVTHFGMLNHAFLVALGTTHIRMLIKQDSINGPRLISRLLADIRTLEESAERLNRAFGGLASSWPV